MIFGFGCGGTTDTIESILADINSILAYIDFG
jgi:hypothetical protein